MQRTTWAMLAMLGMLLGAAAQADPEAKREPSIRWVEDRYTETWSWVLKDAPVEIGGTVWTLDVDARIRDHGQKLSDPSIQLTLSTPTPQAGYVACPDLGLILNGEALQGISLEWKYKQQDGRTFKSATFKVSADRFRRIAAAKTLEARLCNDEFLVDPAILAELRALGAKVRSGAPSLAERQRFREGRG